MHEERQGDLMKEKSAGHCELPEPAGLAGAVVGLGGGLGSVAAACGDDQSTTTTAMRTTTTTAGEE